MKNIKRRKPPSTSSSSNPFLPQPHDQFLSFVGIDGELDRLKHDKQVLITELVKLRQQQQTTRGHLQSMEEKLQSTETKQKQMMAFLARAMKNPRFLNQLIHQKEKRKELEEAISKKRRRFLGESSSNGVKAEPLEFGGFHEGVSELEELALEMQGLGKARRGLEEEEDGEGFGLAMDKELDDGFWEELLSDRLDAEDDEDDNDDDVNVLVDHLAYLGYANPK